MLQTPNTNVVKTGGVRSVEPVGLPSGAVATRSVTHIQDEPELSSKQWTLNAKVSRESTKPRRYSASYIKSFREEGRSFRSNITIPSTASSPGYPLYKDEIDPATYSFTTALKELQARSNCSNWDCMLQEGYALNSKWHEAEKYICNPLSGEVPMECLSAKSLRRKSSSNLLNRITISASVNHPSDNQNVATKPCISSEEAIPDHHIQVKKMVGSTRDVGIQSTLDYPSPISSSDPSSSPAEKKSSVQKKSERGELLNKLEPCVELQVKDTRDKDDKKMDKKKEQAHLYRQSGCFSWVTQKRLQREKHHSKKKEYGISSAHYWMLRTC